MILDHALEKVFVNDKYQGIKEGILEKDDLQSSRVTEILGQIHYRNWTEVSRELLPWLLCVALVYLGHDVFLYTGVFYAINRTWIRWEDGFLLLGLADYLHREQLEITGIWITVIFLLAMIWSAGRPEVFLLECRGEKQQLY